MLHKRAIYTILTAALGALAAAAVAGNKPESADDALVSKLFIGGGPSGAILVADFDGSSFDIVANNTIAGTSTSWLLLKEPNFLYAVDENSDITRLFNVSRSHRQVLTPRTGAGQRRERKHVRRG
jgi:hypothetical protein